MYIVIVKETKLLSKGKSKSGKTVQLLNYSTGISKGNLLVSLAHWWSTSGWFIWCFNYQTEIKSQF